MNSFAHLWTHRYTVELPGSLSAQKPREGFLLKVEWPEIGSPTLPTAGYADLMAWHELGDLHLEEELLALLRGTPTALGRRALQMSRLDAEARASGRSLWDGVQEPPRSHFLAGTLRDLDSLPFDDLRAREFSAIKVKWPRSISYPEAEALLKAATPRLLEAELQLRIDFNGSGSLQECLELFSKLPKEVLDRIDYLEDPFDFTNPSEWTAFQDRFPEIRLYVDRIDEVELRASKSFQEQEELLELAQGWVLKPALQEAEAWGALAAIQKKPVTITHYLGHAVGAAWAARAAAQLSAMNSGLLFGSKILGESAFFADALFTSTSRFPTNVLRQASGIGWTEAEWSSLTWSPWR